MVPMVKCRGGRARRHSRSASCQQVTASGPLRSKLAQQSFGVAMASQQCLLCRMADTAEAIDNRGKILRGYGPQRRLVSEVGSPFLGAEGSIGRILRSAIIGEYDLNLRQTDGAGLPAAYERE